MTSKLTEVSATLLKGKITENKVLTYFLELGYVPSIPALPCQYDLLLDVHNKILKIKVKSCREHNEGEYLEFNTVSMTHNNKGYTKREYDANMVDYFCTYYNDKCYLIPFNECGNRSKRLRLLPTKNGQTKNISFAENYLAEKILAEV